MAYSMTPVNNQTPQTDRNFFDSPIAKPLFIALGIITLIGGFTAAGLLYSTMGGSAFSFAIVGFVITVMLITILICKNRNQPISGGDQTLNPPITGSGNQTLNPPITGSGNQTSQGAQVGGRRVTQLDYRSFNSLASDQRRVENERFQQEPRVRGTHMSDYSIVAPETVLFVKEGSFTPAIERSIGVMLGMAVGDSVGAPYEFLPYRADPYRADELQNRFHLQPGQWTDDTSMGLCVADMLITYPDNLIQMQLMWAFHDWWYYGYNNAFTAGEPRPSIGLGGNISSAFQEFRAGTEVNQATNQRTGPFRHDLAEDYETPAGDQFTSGNGSLMRNGPVAIHARTVGEAMYLAERQSRVTHKGDEAAQCCRLMAFIIWHAIHSTESNPAQIKRVLLESIRRFNSSVSSVNGLAQSQEAVENPQTHQMENWNWQSPTFSYNANRLQQQPGYIGAYAMDGLAMALHCVFTTTTFQEAILKAVSHGGDADTVGAITGQIAGAIYGRTGIPEEWIDDVEQWDRGGEIAARGHMLAIHD